MPHMTDLKNVAVADADPSAPKRRSNDLEPAHPNANPATFDPELLYAEMRAGKRSIESLAPLIPLDTAFNWHAQRRITEAEFSALMADLDIQEVLIDDLPTQKSAAQDAEQQRANAITSAFHARMASFDVTTSLDIIGETELKAALLTKTPLVDGIGIRMVFAKTADDSRAKAGTPPQLTLLCRAYIASTSMQSTVKCEAVFTAPGMDREMYCRIVVPLPIHCGGRRRLLVAILDNETRQPVNLPQAVADVFHEKYLFELQLLKKSTDAGGGFGSAVKGAFQRMFKN